MDFFIRMLQKRIILLFSFVHRGTDFLPFHFKNIFTPVPYLSSVFFIYYYTSLT